MDSPVTEAELVEALTQAQVPRRRAIIAKVAGLSGIHAPQREWEFTRGEFSAQVECSYEMAGRELERLVQEKVLKKRQAVTEGRRSWLYWRPEDEPDTEGQTEV